MVWWEIFLAWRMIFCDGMVIRWWKIVRRRWQIGFTWFFVTRQYWRRTCFMVRRKLRWKILLHRWFIVWLDCGARRQVFLHWGLIMRFDG